MDDVRHLTFGLPPLNSWKIIYSSRSGIEDFEKV
jgi:hypothetical protein